MPPITQLLARFGMVAAALATAGCDVLSGLDDLAPPEPAPPIEVAWVKQIGGGSSEYVSALAVDPDGNLVLGGNFSATLDLGGGQLVNVNNSDIFIAKLTGDGDHLWSRSFGDPRAATVMALAIGHAGEIAFTGRLRDTIDIDGPISSSQLLADAVMVVRLDAAGNVLWKRVMKGEGQQQRPYDMAITDLGDIVVVGEFTGTARFEGEVTSAEITSEGAHDAFVWVLDPHGELRSLRSYGDAEEQRASAVACDGEDIVFAGTTFGTIAVDDATLPTHGSSDPFVMRVDPLGGFKWGATIGNAERNCHEWCEQALAIDDDHRVFYTGAHTGTVGIGDHAVGGSFGASVWAFLLERYGMAGEPSASWGASFGDDAIQRPSDAAFHGGSRPIVTGLFTGAIDFGGGALENADLTRDVFVAGFEENGAPWFSVAMAIDDEDDVLTFPHLAVHPSGDLIVAGSFSGTMRIGDHVLTSHSGSRDIFVARLTGSALALR